MTDRKSRRVVIINNINSSTIDQAIFILKSDKREQMTHKIENNIAIEAQEIIDRYVRQVERIKSNFSPNFCAKKPSRKPFAIVASLIAILCLSVIFYAAGNLLG